MHTHLPRPRSSRGAPACRPGRTGPLVALAGLLLLLGASPPDRGGAEPSPTRPAAWDSPVATVEKRNGDVAGVHPRRALALRGLAVLRRWDARRAAAYSAGDPSLLGDLYTRTSEAGRRDLALLTRYVERGSVVRGVVPQIHSVEVTTARPGRLRVQVRERFSVLVVEPRPAGTIERRAGERRYRDRVVSLRRTQGGWRVASVGRA